MERGDSNAGSYFLQVDKNCECDSYRAVINAAEADSRRSHRVAQQADAIDWDMLTEIGYDEKLFSLEKKYSIIETNCQTYDCSV